MSSIKKVRQSLYRAGQTPRMTEVPRFQDSRHMKVVRLPALGTGLLYPPGNIPDTHFCWKHCRPQVHSAAGRIMPIKNSNDIVWNRTRDLPACSAVPQATAPPRAPDVLHYVRLFHEHRVTVLKIVRPLLRTRRNELGTVTNW